jgi:hypothetical protein
VGGRARGAGAVRLGFGGHQHTAAIGVMYGAVS